MMSRCILILLLFTLVSCERDAEELKYRSIKKEDFKEIPIISEKYFFEEIINASSLALQGDKVLISEYHNIPDESPRIHIINSKDWTYNKPKGRFGRGPLEIFDPQLIVSEDPDIFWVYDYNNRKFAKFSIQDTSLLADSDLKITDQMMGPISPSFAPNGNYLGVPREGEFKIQEFDLNGNLIANYGEFETLEERPDLTKLQISLVNSGRFNGNQGNEIYVRTSMYRDLLEIFNYNTKKFFPVIGPDLNLPEFEYHQSKFGGMISFSPDFPKKYQEVAVSEHFIFALYSGYSHQDYTNSGLVSKEIRVFDLQGKPRWRLRLDRSISQISINEATNEIYGLTTDAEPGIAVFDIPKELLKK
jgi:hypothetical protein